MAITIVKGYLNSSNHYCPNSTNTWSDYTSWDTWTNWNDAADDVEIRIDDSFDTVDLLTPTINLSYQGTLSLTLKISDTGSFAGEETTYTVSTTPFTIIAGRYYRWTITVSPDGTIPGEIFYAATDYSKEYRTQEFKDISTSGLSGSSSARTVTHDLGTVFNVQITAKEATPWVDRAYVLPDSYVDPTNIAPIPEIISKSPLQIALRDYFGVYVDGVVDLTITGSPKIYLTATGVVIL